MRTTVTMQSGEKHYARGYAGQIANTIETEFKAGVKLTRLEKYSIPTGQMFYIDPAKVESVKDET